MEIAFDFMWGASVGIEWLPVDDDEDDELFSQVKSILEIRLVIVKFAIIFFKED